MDIRKLWRTYNTSLFTILPILKNISEKYDESVMFKTKNITFIQLCFQFGLINTFCHTDIFNNDENNMYLNILFSDKVLNKDMLDTNSNYFSFNELLIDNKYFNNVYNYKDDIILYSFNIPKKFYKDIKLIQQSKYSKVSKEYKKEVFVSYDRVFTEDSLIDKAIFSNLSYSIFIKSISLKNKLEDLFNTSIDLNNEFFERFDENNELITLDKLEKIHNDKIEQRPCNIRVHENI